MFRSGFEARTLQFGDIEYYYIPDQQRNPSSIFFPPVEFDNAIIETLREYPKNLFQISGSNRMYEAHKSSQIPQPVRFGTIYHKDYEYAISALIGETGVKVFFINPLIPGIEFTLKHIKDYFKVAYIIIIKEAPFDLSPYAEILIQSRTTFFTKLKRDSNKINEMLSAVWPGGFSFNFKIPEYTFFHGYNEFTRFRPAQNNYYMLNQIVCNDWNGDIKEFKNTCEEESEAVIRGDKNDLSRLNLLIEQVDKIDKIEYNFIKFNNIDFPNGMDEWMSPLVLIIPFNFPYIDVVLPKGVQFRNWDALRSLMNMEQTAAYLYYKENSPEPTESEILDYANLASAKASYLDSVAFLHASFTFSPMVRLPHLGNSIKKELGFFKPEAINESNIKSSKANILKFGKQLTKRILPNDTVNDLFVLPRQIVAISDLPVEWMVYQDDHLSFTHDVTRIPETPYDGTLSTFAVNSLFKLEIGDDILQDTLVLFCATSEDDAEFDKYFKVIEDLSIKLGFKTFRCRSSRDVIEKVNEINPTILIFDCHGNFDKETLSSYLIVNKDDRITGEMIVTEKIFAPIVFLSACHTNPNYGYINRLADAFFEAGCISVTATYFPISIRSGFNVYLRILNCLDHACRNPIHKNWLGFVSHIIRTSYIMDLSTHAIEFTAKSSLTDSDKLKLIKQIQDITIKANIQMTRFHGRVDAKKNFLKELKTLLPTTFPNIDRIVPENSFYTSVGRGDLILFKTWMNHYKMNNSKLAISPMEQ